MNEFRDDLPIYLQLQKIIEEQILASALKEDDKLKSLREMAAEYRINPITASNAVNALVEEGILYQKRGIGMFVATNAREKIIQSRRKGFMEDALRPALKQAKSYEFTKKEILTILDEVYEDE